jgi:hypothetical protein
MERESFSDPAIAELMNREFVNIKLDREERPELDEALKRADAVCVGNLTDTFDPLRWMRCSSTSVASGVRGCTLSPQRKIRVTLGASMTSRVLAVHDQDLSARVVGRWPMVYSAAADCLQDRPAHVRAGSGMVMIGGRLAVIQDDAHFVAVVDTNDRTVEAIALPVGHQGQRQFDDLRGNKQWKTDLEACTTIVESGREALLIMGSGSSAQREQILIVDWPPTNEQDIKHFHAERFYATLRSQLDFAGCELNIEGAVLLGDDCLWLFQRGNGAACREQVPLNATCNISWRRLREHLDDPASVPPPRLQNIIQYDLGLLDAVPLGFTDGASRNGTMFFTATAEASPNSVADGPVTGSVLGQIDGDGAARWAMLQNSDGTRFSGKVEGLVLDAAVDSRAWIVIDRDDPHVPSELCEIDLRGGWSVA